MNRSKKVNRWGILLSATGIHISIGSVYAWSIMVYPIMSYTGWSMSEITLAFSLAILSLGVSAGSLGGLVNKYGIKKSSFLSALLFSIGMFGTAYAISIQNLILLYLSYGIISGIALGLEYVTPISALMRYFYSFRAFAPGLAIMGFGFAAMIVAPLMNFLTIKIGVVETFLLIGVLYMIIVTILSNYLDFETYVGAKNIYIPDNNNTGITLKKSIRTWQFVILWWIFFVNIACGIGLLSVAAPIAETIGMSISKAALIVGVIGLLNGFCRIVWKILLDITKNRWVYFIICIMEAFLLICLLGTNDTILFICIIFFVVSCYGGSFSFMERSITDLFGAKYLNNIHNILLFSVWSIAGLFGPLIIVKLYESTGHYYMAIKIFTVLLIINIILGLLLCIAEKPIDKAAMKE